MKDQKKNYLPEEGEKIIELEIERLRPFKNHPFKVEDDNQMMQLKESIQCYGILTPLIVRPLPEGIYEIISGHRRKRAAELLNHRKVPVIIRVMKDEESVIAMVDANMQREKLSYSEKANAYNMKNEALKRKRGRKKKGLPDDELKGKRTIELIAEESGESYKQIQRYIRLTKLHPTLMQMLDEGNIGFGPATEIACLSLKEQEDFVKAMEYSQSSPSLSQAQRLKELSKKGHVTLKIMEDVMSEIKKGEIQRVSFSNEQLHRFFPKDFTAAQMKREILDILKFWIQQNWNH